MSIPNHLPSQYRYSDVQIFNLPSTVTNLQWHSYLKPVWASMLHITCIGGGGGGGGGFTDIAGNARGGGGGGGSSAITRVTIPAIYLPDRLYIQVGAGGAGVGSGGGTAGSGVLSYVAVYPNTNTAAVNVIAGSGAAGAVGGVTGTGAAAGTGGAAGTVATTGAMSLGLNGHTDFIVGTIGSAGGVVTGAIGVASAIPTAAAMTMGGAGGAGVTGADFAGGIITAVANSLVSDRAPQGAAAGSFNGSGGYLSMAPFFSYCGLGGSASNAGVGGAGGPGGPGSGGGGGGGGTTGGRGGDGGNGIVIITAW